MNGKNMKKYSKDDKRHESSVQLSKIRPKEPEQKRSYAAWRNK